MPPTLTPLEAARRLLAIRHELEARARYTFDAYFPETGPLRRGKYLRHMEFFAAGASHKERLFSAGNRVGKTDAGAYEMTCHLTGLYPEWWVGRRFDRPVEAWASGTTSETTRDIIQSKLFGSWKDVGDNAPYTGMVPRHLIVQTSRRAHALPGALETVWVRHVSGGVSQIGLKAYQQGRESYEGTAKDVVWNDEEPPGDIYTEGLFRTLTTKGIVYTTFTPLQGMSEVVSGFFEATDAVKAAGKIVIQAGWDDVPHLDATERALLIASTPPYQREARTKGVPTLGAGAIYGIEEDAIVVTDFAIPKHWKRCWGGDVGGGAKPTAAAWLARDPESGCVYVYSVYKRESPEPALHIEAIKARGVWIPGVMDAAALILSRDDAEQLIAVYRRGGLTLSLPDKAVESGIQAVWELMSAGAFKVFRSCEPWLREWRKYHRDQKGRVVKVDDHLMDATRYAVFSGLAQAQNEADTLVAATRPRYAPIALGGVTGTGYLAG